MKTLKQHLAIKLKNPEFNKLYEEQRKLIEISLHVMEARIARNLSQEKLADRAGITQQQLSRIENGSNFNIVTLLKLLDVLDLRIDLRSRRPLKKAS